MLLRDNLYMSCKIIAVGKRRDGGTRYWCLGHHANATAKYGVAADKCVAADDPPITAEETLHLDFADYPGGIALWGSVPAVYDTTTQPTDRGIHVHARSNAGGLKDIDRTYRRLRIPHRAVCSQTAGLTSMKSTRSITWSRASSVSRRSLSNVSIAVFRTWTATGSPCIRIASTSVTGVDATSLTQVLASAIRSPSCATYWELRLQRSGRLLNLSQSSNATTQGASRYGDRIQQSSGHRMIPR